MSADKRVDAYIEKAQPFAQPILIHIRKLIHKVCPDLVETMKWSFPHFDHKGATLCSMAAFKQHCAFGFWKASLMSDPHKLFPAGERSAMGHFGQIKSLKDLPSDKILMQYMKEAMKLNEEGRKVSRTNRVSEPKELFIPDYFIETVGKNKKAMKTFEDFSYSKKKEYVTWVTEAKTEKTRSARLATAVEWMSEGKIRNWKYVGK